MPTITVESTVDDTAFRRGFARRVSMWLRAQGVDINHVITKFHPVDAERVFSGPYPLATPPGADGPAPFAFVRCTVGHTRGPEFRQGLAAEIARILGPAVPPARTFIQFDPVDPALHLTGDQATPRSHHDE